MMYSDKHPGTHSDRCRASEQRLVAQVYRDADGHLRWRENHLQCPPYVVRIASFYPDAVEPESPNLRGQRQRMEAARNAPQENTFMGGEP